MDIALMRTFRETARQLNMTRAADALGYAQSSVTAQIRKLEQEYGVPLFERDGRGIRLTAGGRQLLAYADRFLDLAEESKQAVSAETAGALAIGTTESMAAFYLPPYVRRMKLAFPQTELLLQTGNETEVLQGVKRGEYDVGVLLERKCPDPELVCVTLREEPLVLVARPDHPLAGAAEVVPGDFAVHAWVAPERSCAYRNALVGLLADCGVRPQLSCELGSVEAIKRCVLHGLGLSLLPAGAVEAELADGRLVPLPFSHPELRFFVQLVYPAGRWVSRTLTAFVDLLRDVSPPAASSAGPDSP
ncbi:LysR family transcriptional regulator [Paenibacillus flagellatus]|uniref:LysR family transcriptional regulator n=1 Tax=Paenibacillus flagellatus TaxID=2211139 RepID=A0A2V5KE39_9BACL|nr:LysR family transcriptional regulator [Paenibacillus flagellatus]PYI57302.1 LysR family transcriptional regulator [Paenibacillus flagellatus]